MKIIHICLANYYIDNYNYQENALTRQNHLDGHEVIIIASTRTLSQGIHVAYTTPQSYSTVEGIKVIRLAYKPILVKKVNSHINCYIGLEDVLNHSKPDVILFHGINSVEINTVLRYKKKNPHVRWFVDNHTWFGQAGYRTNIGKFLRIAFHRTVFKPQIHKALPYIEKILNVSVECAQFLQKVYRVPNDKMEFFPLGGNIIEMPDRLQRSRNIRNQLGISERQTVYIHTGRLSAYKRTIDILDAFRQNQDSESRLLIIGVIAEDIRKTIQNKIQEDKRVIFLGWKNTDELLAYMCAADVYIQPGNQSASMQNALCCGCAVMIAPCDSHVPFMDGNGFFVESIDDMIKCFLIINQNEEILEQMSRNSYLIARELLDYRKLASRLYQ